MSLCFMPLCLYGSVSLCLWDERCSRDLWLYVGRTSGISPSKVPNRTDVSFFPGSQTDHQPNRDASESTAPGKLRKPKTFNTSCCVPILIYSTLIQAPRKLQAFNNKCSAIFLPSLALPYWSLAGFRPLLSQVLHKETAHRAFG